MMSWFRYSALLLSVLVAACGGKGSPADPPTDLTVQSIGDTQVTLNWTAQPGVQYWVLCAPGTAIDTVHWPNTSTNSYNTAGDGGVSIYNGDTSLANQLVTPPFNVTGLRNDVTYSFTVNGRTNKGPAGVPATPVTNMPRLAGGNWSSFGSVANAANIRAVTYGFVPSPLDSINRAQLFVAVGDGGAVYTSADNQRSWTVQTLPTTAVGQQLNDVTYTSGRFIAIGNAGTIVYSTDGVTWAAATIDRPSSTDLTSIATNGPMLVVVGQGGTVLTSGDGGVTWATQTTNITQKLNAVAYSRAVATTIPAVNTIAAFWVAVGDAGVVYTSFDGATWTARNTHLESATGAWRGVSVLVNTTSTLDCAMPNNKLTSTTSYSIALVGDDGQVATAGPDLSWTLSILPGMPRLNRVISPAGRFVAVGDVGAIYTGTLQNNDSSITWSRASIDISGYNTNLNGLIRYGNDAGLTYSNSYLAYGQGGGVLYSR